MGSQTGVGAVGERVSVGRAGRWWAGCVQWHGMVPPVRGTKKVAGVPCPAMGARQRQMACVMHVVLPMQDMLWVQPSVVHGANHGQKVVPTMQRRPPPLSPRTAPQEIRDGDIGSRELQGARLYGSDMSRGVSPTVCRRKVEARPGAVARAARLWRPARNDRARNAFCRKRRI